MIRTLCRFVLALCLCSVGSYARAQNSTVSGEVSDEQGAVIPGAEVKIVHQTQGTTRTARTNHAGYYNAPFLDPGPYRVYVQAPNFNTAASDSIVLTVGQTLVFNVQLKPGSAAQSVTVNGGDELINTSTAEIGQVMNEAAIKDLPLNGRDPSSLVFLAPGVTNELESHAATLPTTNSFPTESAASAGGGRQGGTWYLLDGVSNMDTFAMLAAPFPNADATQEFRVISNNFDARYGFAPNAVVSIQTKSGSNQFHGGLFEFLRNNDLNASNYFTHAVDPLKRNQFGGYLGGPVLKDKLFFFANYQGTRTSQTSSSNVTYTPTAAMLNGDFSALPITLPAPFATLNGKPNQINPSKFSPGAVAIAKSLPLGGSPATGLTNYVNPAARTDYDEGTARLDYTINDTQRVFLRSFVYNYNQPGTTIPGNILAGVQGQHGIYLNEVANHTWIISPSLINSVSLAYSSVDYGTGTVVHDANGNAVCLSRFINANDPVGACYISGLSAFDGNSLYGGGQGFAAFSGNPNDTKRRDWWLTETLTKTFGKHSLVVGADLLHRYGHESSGGNVNPNVSFTGQYTGFELSDFLLGYVASFGQGAGESGSTHGWMVGLYASDQYRMKTNLTLTAGLRWDPNFPFTVVNGRGAAFIPGQQSTRFPNAPLGLVFPGDKGINAGLMHTTYGYFEPRIGIAWQSSPNTAVRVGFGLFTTPLEDAFYSHVWDTAPFAPTYGLNGTASTPISFDNPWSGFAGTGGKSPFPPFASPSYVPPPNSAFVTPIQLQAVFAPNYKLGVTQSWNLSIEQQIAKSFAMHLAYVGSQSYHQATPVDLNPGIYANGGKRTIYSNFSEILQAQDGGTGTYHALQGGFEERFTHGLQFQSNFTWSRTTDVGGSGDPSFEASVSDPFNIKHDYGPSSLNYPIIWVSNLIYQAPLLSQRNLIVKNLLGGWEISGLYTTQSGPPFKINGGNGNNNSGFNEHQDRADLTGQPFNVRTGGKSHWINQYFNPAAFKPNAPGTPGNSPKFLIQTAPINTMDLALIRNWMFVERYHLQFRWEMFNALNHPSFGQPDSNPTDSNFGQITSIGVIAPRVMQGGLKLSF
jgi:Carboxypeptidase regulatory-like domain